MSRLLLGAKGGKKKKNVREARGGSDFMLRLGGGGQEGEIESRRGRESGSESECAKGSEIGRESESESGSEGGGESEGGREGESGGGSGGEARARERARARARQTILRESRNGTPQRLPGHRDIAWEKRRGKRKKKGEKKNR